MSQLDTFGQATLSAAGVALVSIPVPRQERWHLQRYTVLTNQASTVTTMPIATLYANQVADGSAIDSTYTGARDSGDCDIWFEGGSFILARWTGGVAGTIATLSIFGQRESA